MSRGCSASPSLPLSPSRPVPRRRADGPLRRPALRRHEEEQWPGQRPSPPPPVPEGEERTPRRGVAGSPTPRHCPGGKRASADPYLNTAVTGWSRGTRRFLLMFHIPTPSQVWATPAKLWFRSQTFRDKDAFSRVGRTLEFSQWIQCI